tara:strand:+ start:149 stop:604 length:456 start_codon:yes stop_codon:yes gene_type:complete
MVRTLEGKHDKYFEAILQLRDVGQEVIDYVDSEFVAAKMPITDFSKVRGGYDYKVADNNFTRALGKRLRSKFGGEIKESASLHTKISGKDAYRVTVMFRQSGFAKGDLVLFGGQKYEVISMYKEIVLRGVGHPEKLRLKYDKMKNIKKFED